MDSQVKSVILGIVSGLAVVGTSYILSGKKGGEKKQVDQNGNQVTQQEEEEEEVKVPVQQQVSLTPIEYLDDVGGTQADHHSPW
jgi:hypothetical protein